MKTIYIADDGTQFNNRQACIEYENKPFIYAIENTFDEYRAKYTRFCSTLEEAKRELQDCCDWYAKTGTGRIYRFRLDTGAEPVRELVYEAT